MKKLILTFALIGALILPNLSWGAGTVVETLREICPDRGSCIKEVTLTCTADAAAATYPSTTLTSVLKGWWLEKVITNPGSTGPTDNWDYVLNDADGVDMLGGTGANRSITASQANWPLVATGVYRAQPINNSVTLVITNNSVNSATVVMKAIFTKQPF